MEHYTPQTSLSELYEEARLDLEAAKRMHAREPSARNSQLLRDKQATFDLLHKHTLGRTLALLAELEAENDYRDEYRE